MNQNFSGLLFRHAYSNGDKLLYYSSNFRNHYETLNVTRNCTSKQIKESFITLSKKHHPDLNKNPSAHVQFLNIQEAYKVLSKPESRAQYDIDLSISRNIPRYTSTWYPTSNKRPTGPLYPNDCYYGIKGLKKQANGTVAMFIVGIALVAFVIQVTIIRYTFAKQHLILKARSAEAQYALDQLKEKSNNTSLEEIQRQQFSRPE
ncbi:hypothetical protein ABEB36_004985 [Hypothenemus hampei]|uniref:J domain-containing protein n=1 Tax=Hypothenemus hampei TaxID=57062 RepID=A0ABD1EWN1_HYPHA